jgi:hypothetical protein
MKSEILHHIPVVLEFVWFDSDSKAISNRFTALKKGFIVIKGGLTNDCQQ